MKTAGGKIAGGIIGACLVAATAAPLDAKPSRDVVRFVPPPLWSGLPADDDGDGNGAYDPATGLGVWVNCLADGAAHHVLTVQYSSSRAGVLKFYADVVPRTGGRTRTAVSVPLRTLTPSHPVLTSKRVITTCSKPYAVYVAYPK